MQARQKKDGCPLSARDQKLIDQCAGREIPSLTVLVGPSGTEEELEEAEIIDELKPHKEDIVIKKQRYDGFVGTNLELVLSTLRTRFLVFIGTATNVCVESTLRHAFFLDYFNILVSDAVSALGPDMLQEATIHNVQTRFGWVTTAENLLAGLGAAET